MSAKIGYLNFCEGEKTIFAEYKDMYAKQITRKRDKYKLQTKLIDSKKKKKKKSTYEAYEVTFDFEVT